MRAAFPFFFPSLPPLIIPIIPYRRPRQRVGADKQQAHGVEERLDRPLVEVLLVKVDVLVGPAVEGARGQVCPRVAADVGGQLLHFEAAEALDELSDEAGHFFEWRWRGKGGSGGSGGEKEF